jgi:hypothetical protein
LRPVYKSDDGTVTFGTLVKASDNFDEHGELTSVVYAVEHRDSQGDIADAEVVKDMAYGFISEGGKVDIRHDGKAVGPDRARVGETFLVQKTDPRFHGWKDADGKPVDLTAAWATVIKIDDPELRKKYRSGEWAGVSMGGTAIVEQEKAELSDLVDALKKAFKPDPEPQTKDSAMDKEQFLALQKTMTDGFTALAKALEPKIEKPEAPPKPPVTVEKKAPVFRGKLTDENAVRKHSLEVRLFELEKGVDFSNPQSVDDFLVDSEEIRKEMAELEAEKKPVRKAGPGQSAGGGAAPGGHEQLTSMVSLDKESMDALAAGVAAADKQNKTRFATAEAQ